MATQPQLVLIEWLDGGRPAPGWQALSDLDDVRARKCVSVGFMIRDGDDAKVIAPNLGSNDGAEDWDQAAGLISIPAAAITNVKRLSTFALASVKRSPLADAQWLRRLA